MTNGLVTLFLCHHCTAFAAMCKGIAANAHYQIGIWKKIFGLHQLPCMSLMKHIVDAVGIDANTTWCITRFCHLVRNFGIVVTALSLFDRLIVVIERGWLAYRLWISLKTLRKKNSRTKMLWIPKLFIVNICEYCFLWGQLPDNEHTINGQNNRFFFLIGLNCWGFRININKTTITQTRNTNITESRSVCGVNTIAIERETEKI